ncbi:MAG: peptidase M20, partial [Chloroflexi bacterium]|nr:peptidase M20 [Chloroflexota bacterium]
MTFEDYCARERVRHLEWLKHYVRMPSISSSPEHRDEVRRCGQWTVDEMEGIGLTHGQLLETGGHPVAYAEWLGAAG